MDVQKLFKILDDRGITQSDIAHILDVSSTSVYYYRSVGTIPPHRFKTLHIWLRTHGIDLLDHFPKSDILAAESYGTWFRKELDQFRVSSEEFAQISDLRVPTLDRILSGVTQSPHRETRDAIEAGIEEVTVEHLHDHPEDALTPAIEAEVIQFLEGVAQKLWITRYERNPKSRKECLALYGYKCSVCGFDFEKTYGEIGKHYIEVHHLIPLSKYEEGRAVNPEHDLRPVCSNCHSIIHRRDPIYSIEELQQEIANAVLSSTAIKDEGYTGLA